MVPVFVCKALRGEPLTIAGDGMQFRKFVYVEDLAEGNVLALKSVARNKIYNLDGVEKVTIRQIAQMIQEILGNVEVTYTATRLGDFPGKEVSSQLAKNELGWEPKTSFEVGVRKYISWFQERELQRKIDWDRFDNSLLD